MFMWKHISNMKKYTKDTLSKKYTSERERFPPATLVPALQLAVLCKNFVYIFFLPPSFLAFFCRGGKLIH